MTEPTLPREIEVYELANRRLYAKTSGGTFALFEDDLSPEELMAIARDIANRRTEQNQASPIKAEAA